MERSQLSWEVVEIFSQPHQTLRGNTTLCLIFVLQQNGWKDLTKISKTDRLYPEIGHMLLFVSQKAQGK